MDFQPVGQLLRGDPGSRSGRTFCPVVVSHPTHLLLSKSCTYNDSTDSSWLLPIKSDDFRACGLILSRYGELLTPPVQPTMILPCSIDEKPLSPPRMTVPLILLDRFHVFPTGIVQICADPKRLRLTGVWPGFLGGYHSWIRSALDPSSQTNGQTCTVHQRGTREAA